MRIPISELATEEVEMEMTPMIDVTFLLLIFFMCTIKFKTLEGKLGAYLPKGEGVAPVPSEPKDAHTFMVQVMAPGQRVLPTAPAQAWVPGSSEEFLLVGHEVQYRIGREAFSSNPLGRDALLGHLRGLQRTDPSRPVRIVTTPGTVHADVVTALDLLTQVGFQEVTFAAH